MGLLTRCGLGVSATSITNESFTNSTDGVASRGSLAYSTGPVDMGSECRQDAGGLEDPYQGGDNGPVPSKGATDGQWQYGQDC